MLAAGTSIVAAEELLNDRPRLASNIAGGLHHAMPACASGFCHVNDVILAIKKLLERFSGAAVWTLTPTTVMGCNTLFYSTDKVLIISIHESGHYLFPGTGFVDEIGEGEGRGNAVSISLLPGAKDDALIKALNEVILPLLKAFRPQVLVTQLGVEGFRTNPLTSSEPTAKGFLQTAESLKALEIQWLALGRGYYVGNVARAWTLAWAAMNDVKIQFQMKCRTPGTGSLPITAYGRSGFATSLIACPRHRRFSRIWVEPYNSSRGRSSRSMRWDEGHPTTPVRPLDRLSRGH